MSAPVCLPCLLCSSAFLLLETVLCAYLAVVAKVRGFFVVFFSLETDEWPDEGGGREREGGREG